MPPFEVDLYGDTQGNQVQPLLVSSQGRYVWSEEPFHSISATGSFVADTEGRRLRVRAAPDRACARPSLHAAETLLSPIGEIPDESLFTHPQFNSWIELTYDQNQEDILVYAHGIVDTASPPAS